MRWFKKPAIKEGDERVFYHFALLPIQVGNEVRWLEMVRYRASYQDFVDTYNWLPLEFLECEPAKKS